MATLRTSCLVKNADVPVYALCRRVDHTDAKLAYAQEVQHRPSEERCKRLCQLLFFVHSCGIQGSLGGGGLLEQS